MKHDISHSLDVATARKVADRAFAEYKSRFPQYNPTVAWVSDRQANIGFSAKGMSLNGSMIISEAKITMDLDVPFFLKPFQKTAIEVIEREVEVWIGKARAGEL